MKKAFLFLSFLISTLSQAQVSTLPHSIGIGQNTLSTIPLHVNKNGEVARFQGTSPYVSFYEGGNWNGYVQAYNNVFALGTKNTFDLNFYTDDLLRLRINASNGQVYAQERFNALSGINLTGPLRVAGNNVGQLGDVLMSLGNGTPAWGSIASNPQIGFRATYTSGFSIPYNTNTFLTGFIEEYDDGNNFANATGEFTVPSAGLYRFEYKMVIDRVPPNPVINNGLLRVKLIVNGNLQSQITFDFKDVGGGLVSKFGFESLKLNQNDIVKFEVYQINENLNPVNIFANNGSGGDPVFVVYKIY
ncbi:hypothetical protein GCM10027035_33980 [Emticicia sediminis]